MSRQPLGHGVRRRVHFVGVGGIGMSGLAEILLNLGYRVSGSDLHASEITDRLKQFGLEFFAGHDASNLGDSAIVVRSSAVAQENPEIASARERAIPVIHRSDLLADLLRLKPNAVVVGGTHGKTTTTSMISSILDRANIGATSIVGGILHRSGTNARWGTGDYIVAEADEHDGSFLRLHPTIGVVTNIDAEHLEFYGTVDRIKRAFLEFCNGIPFYGQSIVCWDDENARSIIPQIEGLCLTYGIGEPASLRGSKIQTVAGGGATLSPSNFAAMRTRFDVTSNDDLFGSRGPLGTLELKTMGEDNVRNALAACAVGLCLGLPFGMIAEGLREFDGVRRRIQVRGEARGVVVIEDYAHHPTEIRSTMAAVRCANPKRVVCVFQPHLYSRTKFLCDDFARVLAQAERAIVTDIYGSREAPMPGVSSALIVDSARKAGSNTVELLSAAADVPAMLAPTLREGDVVLILGAGDINRIAQPLLDALRASA